MKSVATGDGWSERRTRFAQEGDFFGRGTAPQYGVAMRVAAKAGDDGLVAQLIDQVALQTRLREQGHGLRVH